MARTVISPINAHASAKKADDARDTATAEVDAQVQTHHRMLLFLEQSRRAQERMVHDWMQDLLATARTLAFNVDQGQWLHASAALGWALWSNALSAHWATSAALSEYQRSLVDQARASRDVMIGGTWPYERKAQTSTSPARAATGELAWLSNTAKTYEKLVTAWTSAWFPESSHAASRQ